MYKRMSILTKQMKRDDDNFNQHLKSIEKKTNNQLCPMNNISVDKKISF